MNNGYLLEITGLINTFLFGGIVFFIKKLIIKIEDNSENLNKFDTKIQLIEKDIKTLIESSTNLPKMKEDITILIRDHKTAWKKIDFLFKTVDLLKERDHYFANQLQKSVVLLNKVDPNFHFGPMPKSKFNDDSSHEDE